MELVNFKYVQASSDYFEYILANVNTPVIAVGIWLVTLILISEVILVLVALNNIMNFFLFQISK